MGVYRAQVVFPYISGLPGDVMTNTFHFHGPPALPVATMASDITPLLATFYQSIYAVPREMASYMVSANATVNWYSLDDPEPRQAHTVNLGATIPETSSVVPTEVACVLSFQATALSGANQRRRRGRIYLGALSAGWITGGTSTTFPIVSAAAVTAVANAASALRTAVLAIVNRQWVVWSPTGANWSDVANGWVDNALDTQRRRGVEATARTTWS